MALTFDCYWYHVIQYNLLHDITERETPIQRLTGICQSRKLTIGWADQWVNEFCVTEIDECWNVTCKNGGTCKDLKQDYVCECDSEWTGKDCECKYGGGWICW